MFPCLSAALDSHQRPSLRGKYEKPTAAAAWSPLTPSGCIGWYDATDSSTITLTASEVTLWADLSADGNDLAPGDAPAYVTDDYVDFRTAAERLECTYGASTSQPNVVAMTVWPTNSDTYVDGKTTSARHLIGGHPSVGNLWRYSAGTTRNSGTAVTGSAWSLIVGQFNGDSTSNLRLNGTQIHTGATVGTQALGGLTVGAISGGAAGLIGRIGELVVYNTSLTGDELSELETFLANRRSITLP